MTRTLMITAAAIGLVAGGLPAFAAVTPYHAHDSMPDVIVHTPPTAHGPHVASTHVRYHDLNLSTHQGVETLLVRIRKAAKKVCAPAPMGKRSIHETADYKQCLRDAADEAVQGVNSPAVTEAYRTRTS